MITDIILIASIAAFGIIGAVSKFGKASRRIYSLITATGLAVLILVIYQAHVNDVEWLSNIDRVLTQMGAMKNVILLSSILLLSLLLSIALNPLYKLIDVTVASINKPSAVICGGVSGIVNSLILIAVVLQICSIINIKIETNIFKGIQTLISNIGGIEWWWN